MRRYDSIGASEIYSIYDDINSSLRKLKDAVQEIEEAYEGLPSAVDDIDFDIEGEVEAALYEMVPTPRGTTVEDAIAECFRLTNQMKDRDPSYAEIADFIAEYGEWDYVGQ